jgi:hypothetical protein
MSVSICIVSTDSATWKRLSELIPETFTKTLWIPDPDNPDSLPSELPELFILALPGINTPEEKLIERLRSDDSTAAIPIVIVSALSMQELQSVPYASDWTIGIVEEPIEASILMDTMNFLINPEG